MKRSPAILITPSTARKGVEFSDASISLSNRYTEAIIQAGGLPQIFPATTSRAVIAEAVSRSDGVILTGGDDIDPKLYREELPPELARTLSPPEPSRDIWEKSVIDEIFSQRKPLLGICRGHQMLNVALGGTLIVDIATELPGTLDHRQMDKKSDLVHEVEVEPDSLLAELAGRKVFSVNSTHHQAIGRLAAPLRAVAKSSDGVVEAVELKDRGGAPFLLTMQFHPERLIDRSDVFRQIFNGFVEACSRWREKNL